MMQRITQAGLWAMTASLIAAHAVAQVPPASPPAGGGAIVLPEVSLPAVPTPAPGEPSATVPMPPAPGMPPAPPLVETQPAATTRVFSFGTSQLSVLFMPQQIMKMKDAIVAYESEGRSAAPSAVIEAPTQPTEVTNEPPEYPVFFLSSIVYETPSEWSIWLGGHKITSRKNNTDLNILSVSRDSVTFSWSPEYARYITRRRNEGLIASTDDVKHKLVAQQAITSDDQGSITFTLRQNQSFSVGYYSIFEGYMKSPALIPLLAEQTPEGGIPMDPQATGPLAPPLPGMRGQDVPPRPPSAPPPSAGSPMPPILAPNPTN